MDENKNKILIRFENEELSVANKKARRLRSDLLDITPDVDVKIVKDDPTTQDFGATLVVILGTEAVIAIAKGIANYLSRDRGTITIEANGKVVATGISGKDAAEIAKHISSKI